MNNDLEILKRISAEKREGETTAQYWSRLAREQQRKYDAEAKKCDPSELKFRHERSLIFARGWGVTPDDFPLELVATIAAKFVGMRPENTFAEAAERAIGLLQACKHVLATNKETKAAARH